MSSLRRAVLAAVTLVLAAGLGAMVVVTPEVAAVVVPTVVGAAALWAVVAWLAPDDDPMLAGSIARWTTVAFLARLILGGLISTNPGLIQYFGPDASGYHQGAIAITSHWSGVSGPPLLPGGKEGFYYLLAGIYQVVGPHPLAGIAVNAVLGAAIVPVLTDAVRRAYGADVARRVPALTVLIPGLLIWTAQLLREPAVLLLLAVIANLMVRLTRRPTFPAVIALPLTLALLGAFRGYVSLVVFGSIVIAFIVSAGRMRRRLGPALATPVIAGLLVLGAGLGYSGFKVTVETDLQEASELRQATAVGVSSGFDEDVTYSTPGEAAQYLPLASVQFLLGPFPWQIGSIREAPALLDAFLWWLMIPVLWRGIRRARKHDFPLLRLLIPAIALVTVLSLVIGNFGTVVRARTQLLIFLIPFLALGLERVRPQLAPAEFRGPARPRLAVASSAGGPRT